MSDRGDQSEMARDLLGKRCDVHNEWGKGTRTPTRPIPGVPSRFAAHISGPPSPSDPSGIGITYIGAFSAARRSRTRGVGPPVFFRLSVRCSSLPVPAWVRTRPSPSMCVPESAIGGSRGGPKCGTTPFSIGGRQDERLA